MGTLLREYVLYSQKCGTGWSVLWFEGHTYPDALALIFQHLETCIVVIQNVNYIIDFSCATSASIKSVTYMHKSH
jgi:hypothetical protein